MPYTRWSPNFTAFETSQSEIDTRSWGAGLGTGGLARLGGWHAPPCATPLRCAHVTSATTRDVVAEATHAHGAWRTWAGARVPCAMAETLALSKPIKAGACVLSTGHMAATFPSCWRRHRRLPQAIRPWGCATCSRMAQRSRRGDSGQCAMTPEACADRRLGGLFRTARPSLDRPPPTTRGALWARPQTRQRDARRGAGC